VAPLRQFATLGTPDGRVAIGHGRLTLLAITWESRAVSTLGHVRNSRHHKVRPVATQQSVLALDEGSRIVPERNGRRGKPAGIRRPATRLKAADRRLFQALQDPSSVMFLDIETTGLSRYYDEITIIGWLHRGCYHTFIAGDTPSALQAALAASSILVTFNGTLFDLPFLKKSFPGIELPGLHADLRYLARRAKLTGGQKAIERELKLDLRGEVQEVDGAEAVLLWHRYLRGDRYSLRRLIEYNRCDVLGMCWLLDEVLNRLITDPDFWFCPPRFGVLPEEQGADIGRELPCPTRLNRPLNTFQRLFGQSPAEAATVVGIDLTGSEERPSGWCALRGDHAETAMVGSDKEIIERTVSAKPDLISIDSPLSLPFGRTRVTDDDPGRATFGIMRQCERELKRRGINVYPCLLPSMQRLTERGMRLARQFRSIGMPVIESYPGAAQDIMRIPRKGAGMEFLRQGLVGFGVRGAFATEVVTHDELDAITSALVGSFFLAGKFEALSGPSEDPLVIPDLLAKHGPIVVGVSGKIAAGKTTTARILEGEGFAYTRYSLVVDDEIQRRGLIPDRRLRQVVGMELHHSNGQRWLAEQALRRIGDRELIVVDGLRFLEDHAFLVERFGSRFLHIHVATPDDVREFRYLRDQPDGPSFCDLENAPVEAEIPQLSQVANVVLDNIGDTDQLGVRVRQVLRRFLLRNGQECPSLSL